MSTAAGMDQLLLLPNTQITYSNLQPNTRFVKRYHSLSKVSEQGWLRLKPHQLVPALTLLTLPLTPPLCCGVAQRAR